MGDSGGGAAIRINSGEAANSLFYEWRVTRKQTSGAIVKYS